MNASSPTTPILRALPVPQTLAWILLGLVIGPGTMRAAEPPLLPRDTVAFLAREVSGSEALRTVQELALHHRQRGSRGYRAAAEAIRDRARSYGLEKAEIWELPADGEIFYGTQRSRPAWDAEFAELWELEDGPEGPRRSRRIASLDALPITLAEDSASGRVEAAELVDVGEGTSETDYAGKDVRGRLVLAGAQPGPVAPLAVGRFGAVGIVSYAQNQRSAWWKEDETLVRWGHLSTFPEPETFAFMVSLQQARSWRERLAAGEKVLLSAELRAGQHPGSYDIPTAVIPGRDPEVSDEEIVFSCHLDHQQPGANDNAVARRSWRPHGCWRRGFEKAGWHARDAPCASSGRRRSRGRWRCSTRPRSWGFRTSPTGRGR
jgi:aminopeptidase YwaD